MGDFTLRALSTSDLQRRHGKRRRYQVCEPGSSWPEGLTKEKNKVTPRNGKISVLNAKGESMRTWTILGAKPVKWTGPKLAASSRDLAIEELEVCHSGFRSSK